MWLTYQRLWNKIKKKDEQHFKRQSWWDILYQQLKKIPLNTSCENCLLWCCTKKNKNDPFVTQRRAASALSKAPEGQEADRRNKSVHQKWAFLWRQYWNIYIDQHHVRNSTEPHYWVSIFIHFNESYRKMKHKRLNHRYKTRTSHLQRYRDATW